MTETVIFNADVHENSTCQFCGNSVVDFDCMFHANIYQMTGLCQDCQSEV